MSQPSITFACGRYDRVEAIVRGEVRVDGFNIAAVILPASELLPRALMRQEFDVVELSASSYLMQLAMGDAKYTAIPVPIGRAFRHGAIYIRSDRGISDPKSLEGKLVGIPSYQFTAAMWIRGILQDQYDVDFRKMKYRTAAANSGRQVQRPELPLPQYIDISALTAGKSLSAALQEGSIDAVISPEPVECFGTSDSVVRLFENPEELERAYWTATGYFPTMHFIAVRNDVLKKYSGIGEKLFNALVRAKAVAIAKLQEIAKDSANVMTMPWFANEFEKTQRLFGDNFWSYGVEKNHAEFETMCRYAYEQYLTPRLLTINELFDPATLNLRE